MGRGRQAGSPDPRLAQQRWVNNDVEAGRRRTDRDRSHRDEVAPAPRLGTEVAVASPVGW